MYRASAAGVAPGYGHDPSDKAEWKQIQKRVFTSWCNEQLKEQDSPLTIEDLQKDFADGVRLIALVEALSQKKVGRYHKKPRMHAQKMENLEMVLKLLVDVETIPLVNIGAGDIGNGNLKLILGLVWKLILHYQILNIETPPRDDDPPEGLNRAVLAKDVLRGYVQNLVPAKNVTNFTSDWHDGTLIGALVDAIAPGLCPEAYTMDPADALENAQRAMDLAEEWLGVPKILMPQDLVNPNIDPQSVMTYISQFPEAALKTGAPHAKTGDPSLVTVTGQGIEADGPIVYSETEFTVDTTNAGRGPLRVNVIGPEEIEVQPSFTHNDGIYTVKYTPLQKGKHAVSVKWCGEPVPGSPFPVQVAKMPYMVSGPGVDGTDLHAASPAEIWVNSLRPGMKPLIKVSGPKGQLPSSYITTEDEEEEQRCTAFYVPPDRGQYKVDVLVAGRHIGDSPYTVEVDSRKEESMSCAKGPGVEGRNVDVGKRTWFKVFTTGVPGHEKVETKITSPAGVLPTQKSKISDAITKYTYTPTHTGQHNIVVKVGPKEVESVMKFSIMVPSDTSSIDGIDPSALLVTGPGASGKGASVGKPADVYIDTTEVGTVQVEAKVTPPDADEEQNIELTPTKDNPAILQGSYLPGEPGYYDLQVSVASNPVKGFQVPIADPEKVKFSSKSPVYTSPGETHIIDCFTEDAGPGQLSVDSESTPLKVEVKPVEDEDDHYQLLVTAPKEGVYSANICYNEVPVANPIQIMTGNPSNCKISGPGINSKVVANKETHFIVDNSAAGSGEVETTILSPTKEEVESCCAKIRGSQHKVTYIPNEAGDHSIDVQFAGHQLPGSPYSVHVIDPSAVVCETDPKSRVRLGEKVQVLVDARKAGDGNLSLAVAGPEECTLHYDASSESNKPKFTFTPSVPGVYKISATLDELPTSDEPYSLLATDISKVAVSGSGITGKGAQLGMGIQIGKPADVIVDTSESGPGDVKATLKSPSGEVENLVLGIEEEDCPEVFVGHYTPTSPGHYSVDISFDKQPVQDSPFQVRVISPDDVTIVPKDGVAGEECTIDFFLEDVDPEEIAVNFAIPQKEKLPLEYICTKTQDSNRCCIKFTPEKAGDIEATFYYSETLVKDNVPICVVDPQACRVSGPGITDKQVVGEETYITVDTTKAGDGLLMVIPCGVDHIPLTTSLAEEQRGVYVVKYTPKDAGEMTVSVLLNDRNVPNSPFTVAVIDPSMCNVYGPGIEEKQEVGEETYVKVDTTKAGDGSLVVIPSGSDEIPLETSLVENQRGIYTVKYTPKEAGEMTVSVLFDDRNVPNSPFTVDVIDPSMCRVYGPGVEEKQVVGEAAHFTVDTSRAGNGSLTVLPCDIDQYVPEIKEEGGLHAVKYMPKRAGNLSINVLFYDIDVPNSPFIVPVINPSMCQVYGPGVEKKQVAGEETHFTVDTSAAGDGSLAVTSCGPDQDPLQTSLTKIPDGFYEVRYTPKEAGEISISVLFDDKEVAESPFSVSAVDPSKCLVYGPGVEEKQVVGEETHLTIDTTKAGDGALVVSSQDSDQIPVETSVKEEEKGIHVVHYTPKTAGDMTVSILLEDRDVPNSPFTVPVIDPAMCQVYGPGVESKLIAREETHFFIDTAQAGQGQATVNVIASDSSPLETTTAEDQAGLQKISYTPLKGGKVAVDVCFNDRPVPSSPFIVTVIDPTAITIQATCPEVVILGEDITFAVDTTQAGNGNLNFFAEGPEECHSTCKKRKKGLYDFCFTPTVPGDYTFKATFDDINTQEDPTMIKVLDLARALVQKPEVPLRIGQEQSFTVDISAVGKADFTSKAEMADGSQQEGVISGSDSKGVFTTTFTPTCPGPCLVTLIYGGKQIGESPYTLPVIDPSSVVVTGLDNCCGIVSEYLPYQVDTTAAGKGGKLSAFSEGPSESEALLNEPVEGMSLGFITAAYPGEYQLHVSYEDEEVPGSPFFCPFKRPPPDASKVALDNIDAPGEFTIDARNAGGNGQLEVSCSDTYNPANLISIKHNGDYTFAVEVNIKEDATLTVKWHGEHVPGSPFTIHTDK